MSRVVFCVVAVLCSVPAVQPEGVVGEEVRVRCETTTGPILIKMTPERGPLGAQRFMELVEGGFFADVPLFRVVKGFLVQYGIPGHYAEKNKRWTDHTIKDDPHPQPAGRSVLKRGDMSFAGAGPNSRTTQMFITFSDHNGLGTAAHETPFGTVIEGMENVDAFYNGYGDIHPFGKHGPDNGRLWGEGNAYVAKNFPKMDFMKSCNVVREEKVVATEVSSTSEHKEAVEVPVQTKDGDVTALKATTTTTTLPQKRPSPLPFLMILATFIAMCWTNIMSKDTKEQID